MSLAPGTRLGSYEVVSPLGAGGMGEVYRARDTRLGREVAVKVLPAHLSSSPEVRARFEREARTISSLNHPNICTLFDVGREGDTDFLVMELVEGETLAARLAKGALPPADVLKLGAQIADALDRAHRAGVIHRDLKPGNVMLTKSGAKLMDFGLARATGMASSASAATAITQSPTLAQPLTAEGTLVGTFQYMSPEQLEGKEADGRSDIWALGCVLYELATGRRAFDGASQASLIGAIMNTEPAPVSQLAPLAPPALERAVRQCLAKDPDNRWQTAGDLRRELEWISSGSGSGVAPSPTVRRRRRLSGTAGLVGGGIVALAAIGYAFGPWSSRAIDTRLVRFSLVAPARMEVQTPAEAALSPDGTMLAFVANDSASLNHVCVRPLGAPAARVVPGTEGGRLPFWSPDSRMIAFFADGKLQKVALDGNPSVVLCEAPDARGGSWSRGGVILFAPNNAGPIARVPAIGGEPVPVTKLDSQRKELGHRYPQFLPDGRHFLYVAIATGAEPSTFVASLDGGAPVEVCKAATGARYVAPGYLLYVDSPVETNRQRVLARRFDLRTLRASSDAALVLDQVRAANFGYPNITFDDRGTLVVQRWGDVRMHIDWWNPSGAPVGVAVPEVDGLPSGSLSPDARLFAYSATNPPDIFVRDLVSGVSTRLTFESRSYQNLLWSNDGRRLYFAAQTGQAGYEIDSKAADGSGEDSLVFRGPGLFSSPMSVSRDDRWLVAQCSDSSGAFDLWRIPLAGQGKPEIYQRTPANEDGASFSPDGRWLVYSVTNDGKREVFVQSFPVPGTKYQLAIDDIAYCGWVDRQDEMIALTGKGDVLLVSVSTAAGFKQGASRKLFRVGSGFFVIDVQRDMKRFLVASYDTHALSSSLEVVLGWPRLLEKK